MRQKSMMIVWKIFEPWVHQKIQRWHLRTLPWIIKLQRAFSAGWVELTAANEWPRHSCSLQPTLPEWTVATINTLDCYKNAATLENLPDIIILYIRCYNQICYSYMQMWYSLLKARQKTRQANRKPTSGWLPRQRQNAKTKRSTTASRGHLKLPFRKLIIFIFYYCICELFVLAECLCEYESTAGFAG